MERENVLVKILSLVERFIQKVMHFSHFKGIQQVSKLDFYFFMQLSLPADVVSLTYSCEKLLETEVSNLAVLEHLSQLLKDFKSLQVITLFLFVLKVSRFLKVKMFARTGKNNGFPFLDILGYF